MIFERFKSRGLKNIDILCYAVYVEDYYDFVLRYKYIYTKNQSSNV